MESILFLYFLSIFQFIGIFINLLQILVLLQKELRANATYRLMTWICFSDILSQISTFFAFSPFWIHENSGNCKTLLDTISYLLGTIFSDTFQRVSIWLALLICVYEVMKVTKPTKVMTTVFCFVLLSVVWSYLVNLRNVVMPVEIMEEGCSPGTGTRYEIVVAQKHRVLHDRILILDGIVKLIPNFMEVILMALLFKAEKAKCVDERKKRENLTRLILIFMIPYILSGIPGTSINVLQLIYPEHSMVM
ncbi:hypothetical protein GCK72_020952 [Caenorhabditis remanei]|uniref:G-protein coupled receptors family 1 profile domain-containing protein n=1 Tax=Caenorhabditis remanei TaxID=31234 RepID=A0A6A5GIG5_CAERE|nr:hypothetical protein GCK72_020952 [Caenorhabditis remanei]KAF1754391.1 hypothetical protein GCK72_020952 [Caenorhabditis remanei]